MSVRPLPSVLADMAKTELNENSEVLKDGIHHLKQWIMEQPHLKVRTDDQWLAAFLRGCKFNLEQSKTKIDLYFSFRSTAPYLYSVKYFEPKFMDILDLGCTLILRETKNPADPRVLLYRFGQYDPKKYTLMDILSVLTLLKQICFMEDDNFVVAGTIHVVDLAGSRLAHYTQVSPKQVRSLIAANQEALPIRIKAIHFVNAPSFFGYFFNFCKTFMSAKIKQRITVHTNKDMVSFHEYVPKEILPEEYGGTGESVQECIGYWKKKASDFSTFFEEDLEFRSDETIVPVTRSYKLCKQTVKD